MLLKEAIDGSIRSRHVGIIRRCLQHEDGLTYGELYTAYCKRCEEKDVKPMARTSLHNFIQYCAEKDIVRIEYYNPGIGIYRIGKRVWLKK
jgi:Cdc6-like AAA superfamily ATPase